MRRFGEVVLQTYLFITLCSGTMGITEVLTQVLGWQQAWFSAVVGFASIIWFLATFFFIMLFRMYRIPHVYYILPLFYVTSYILLSSFAFLVSWQRITWSWLPVFFLTAAFLSSSFELIFAGAQLGKLSALKKGVKTGKKQLHL